MSLTAVRTELTSAQIRTLRTAFESTTFHLHEGQGRIKVWGRDAVGGSYPALVVETDSTVVDYSREASWTDQEALRGYSAFHSESSGPKYNQDLATLWSRLRPGDALSLRWVRSNDNDNNRRIGWHRDELHLVINHKSGTVESYLVDVSVGPDNTARMVRKD